MGPLCIVSAWRQTVRLVPPALLSLDELLLTPRELTPHLRDALHTAGIPKADRFTLHGLHRGAAQACAALGAGLDAIKEQGTWSFSAEHTYMPKLASCVAPP